MSPSGVAFLGLVRSAHHKVTSGQPMTVGETLAEVANNLFRAGYALGGEQVLDALSALSAAEAAREVRHG